MRIWQILCRIRGRLRCRFLGRLALCLSDAVSLLGVGEALKREIAGLGFGGLVVMGICALGLRLV